MKIRSWVCCLAVILFTGSVRAIEGEFIFTETSDLTIKMAESQTDPAVRKRMLETAQMFLQRIEIRGDVLVLFHGGPGWTKMSFTTNGNFLLAVSKENDGSEKYYPFYIKDDDHLYTEGKKFTRVQK